MLNVYDWSWLSAFEYRCSDDLKQTLQFLRMVPGLDDPNYVGVVNLLGGVLAGVTAASLNLPIHWTLSELVWQRR